MRAAILARIPGMVHLGNRGLRHSCGFVRGLWSVNAHGISSAGAVEPSSQPLPAPASAQSPDGRPAEARVRRLRYLRAPSRPTAPSGPVASQATAPASPAHQRPPRPTTTPQSRRPLLRRRPLHRHPPSRRLRRAIGGDPTAGRQVYRKCQACHSLEAGKNALGPSLAGIVGKKSGEVPNYNYSAAMKAANIVWDAATLDAYLLDPQKLIPQNKMPFPGLKTANERKDVIAYLVAATSPAGAPAVAQRAQPPAAAPAQPSAPADQRAVGYVPDARYTLRSGIADGRMVYLGVGGTIDGQVNPVLSAAEGQTVQIILINGEGAEHDIVFPDQDAKSPRITRPRRKHDHRLPRDARRRFRLPVQCPRSRSGGHARTIHRHASAARSGLG